jgi:glycosyltransferase involved in cell wall biosynthesis
MVKNNKIWLVNADAMPPKLESRLRTIKFAHYLGKKGYDVTIFSSSIMHNMDVDLIEGGEQYIESCYDDLKFVFIKTRNYKNSKLIRLIGLIEFSFKLHFLRHKFAQPGVIIHTANIPFENILYFTAKRLKAKYIVEILDLWPQTFVDLKLVGKRNPLLYFSYLAEKWLYKKADKVVFSMEGGADYIRDKGWDTSSDSVIDLKNIFYINNGVDLNDFYKYKEIYDLKDDDLDDDSIRKIVYIGSIRYANNLLELINAAELLKDDLSLRFLIYGDGEDRSSLMHYCSEKNLTNIIFKQKWIDPHYVPSLLSKSTLNILNYKSGEFGKYGGSQSKLFQYLASGRPICSNLKMGYCLINANNLGISKIFNSSEEYSEAIRSLVNLPENKKHQMSERSKEVVKNFDYEYLAGKMIKLIEMERRE